MMEHKPDQKHPANRKIAWKFAAASAGLATVTAVAAFNGAGGIAIVAGIATGVSLPATAYMLFAEGMNA